MGRRVVLLRPPRPGTAGTEEGRGRRGRGRGRVLGRPRRRALPLAEVPPRPGRDARAPALVQVGGLHHLALRLRADGRPLLLRRGRPARGSRRRRPPGVAGDRAQPRGHGARLGRLRRALPDARTAERGRARGRRHGARRARRVGIRRALLPASGVPSGRRDARDDHGRERLLRDHPGPPEARRRHGGEARARPGPPSRREGPVGPQQLPHPARALHHARRATSRSCSRQTKPGSSSSRSPC